MRLGMIVQCEFWRIRWRSWIKFIKWITIGGLSGLLNLSGHGNSRGGGRQAANGVVFNHKELGISSKINLLPEKRLVKKIMCKCIDEYSNNLSANFKKYYRR